MEQYQNNNKFPDDTPYWVKRVAQATSRNAQRTTEQTMQELRKLYEEQNQVLYNNLLDVFLKIQTASESEDGKIYTNDLYKTNNYYLLIQHFNECAKAIGGKQLEITDAAMLRTYQYAQSVVEGFAPKGMMKSNFVIPEAIKAERAVNHTWCLDGKEFSDRIWLSKQALIKDLSRTMGDYLARGENPYVIASGISKRLDVDLYCAYRIARTEVAHMEVQGQVDKYKEMGFAQGEWFTTDGCDECQELNGQQFPLDQIQTMLPRHPNCTCSFLLVVD